MMPLSDSEPAEPLLLTPGPVQVPREVLEAGAAQMTHHNASEFQILYKRLLQDLRPIFGNDGPILIQNSSGRGAMEASLVNLFSPGDAVAVIVNGRFGLRFAAIARDLGLVVHPVSPEWEHTANEDAIADTLTQHPEIKGLIGLHVRDRNGRGERSGYDRAPRKTLRRHYDRRCGLGRRRHADTNERTESRRCFSGIQKCFMCPPGLAIIATSERTWDAIRASRHYRHYFHWVKMREWIKIPKIRMMGTPPESLMRSLACAVRMMHAEGLSNVYARHALLAEGFHSFVHAVGCHLVAKDPDYRSNTLSAMVLPAGINARAVVQQALENDRVALAIGQDNLKETVIRMGHMGAVQPDMLLRGVQALARALASRGMDRALAERGLEACETVPARGARPRRQPSAIGQGQS